MRNPVILLQSLTNQDQPDFSLPLLEDEQLVSVVNSWNKIRVEWNPPDTLPDIPLSDHDLWSLLWEYSFWDMEDLAIAAGVTEAMAARCFIRAKLCRLIYPDGSVSNSSKRVIALIIGSTLGEMAFRAKGITTKSDGKKEEKEKYDGEV